MFSLWHHNAQQWCLMADPISLAPSDKFPSLDAAIEWACAHGPGDSFSAFNQASNIKRGSGLRQHWFCTRRGR